MKNFCTVADRKFYNKVSALNYSLGEYSNSYILHLLCVDDEIFEKCKNKENMICYKLYDLIKSDSLLEKSRNNKPSKEALILSHNDIEVAKKIQFSWLLSSYFSWWCLDNLGAEDILYIDADIYFYSDYNTLYNYLDNCSVGIVEHRCPYNPDNGKYNVGVVYFKNDLDGYKCCTWWKNCLLLTNHEFYLSHGRCGDQKYLELFSELFDNVKVLDPFIGHLAPWNFIYHSYKEDKIIWDNKEQELLYCHFSDFQADFFNNQYILAQRHGFKDPPNNFIKKISNKYYNVLKEFNSD